MIPVGKEVIGQDKRENKQTVGGKRARAFPHKLKIFLKEGKL